VLADTATLCSGPRGGATPPTIRPALTPSRDVAFRGRRRTGSFADARGSDRHTVQAFRFGRFVRCALCDIKLDAVFAIRDIGGA
jgi:hypothetical protein